ncbi:MAG: hypothetical protein ACRCXZ_00810 [Patescibacteria group bacterium]
MKIQTSCWIFCCIEILAFAYRFFYQLGFFNGAVGFSGLFDKVTLVVVGCFICCLFLYFYMNEVNKFDAILTTLGLIPVLIWLSLYLNLFWMDPYFGVLVYFGTIIALVILTVPAIATMIHNCFK